MDVTLHEKIGILNNRQVMNGRLEPTLLSYEFVESLKIQRALDNKVTRLESELVQIKQAMLDLCDKVEPLLPKAKKAK